MSAQEIPAQVMNTKPLFKLMVEKKASDLFFTCNAPVKIKIEGQYMEHILNERFQYTRVWIRHSGGWKVIAGSAFRI